MPYDPDDDTATLDALINDLFYPGGRGPRALQHADADEIRTILSRHAAQIYADGMADGGA